NTGCAADCPNPLQTGTGNGCGNQALYNQQPLGDPGHPADTSYDTLAGIMADDELFLDTSKTMCLYYLAVEFGAATGMTHNTCGGRGPKYDVMDFPLPLGSMGVFGFTLAANFDPKVKDGAAPHSDILDDFPSPGPPH